MSCRPRDTPAGTLLTPGLELIGRKIFIRAATTTAATNASASGLLTTRVAVFAVTVLSGPPTGSTPCYCVVTEGEFVVLPREHL
jgi:hypothetical protein